ncbi:M23 family metallopeptidase [Glycomyces salinus]|uniref:M23 family metallopeptidase n=1 Tax=Glycomyces salinus TaxID=980294 RepID=UPI0018EABD45|nr:M23 family metallopeptidase [Glycomyces salinus]
MSIRRHAARPHRVRGQHRASWAAELSPLFQDTQRRYTAVVGSAVAGASAVALAAAAGLPSDDPESTTSGAVAEIAALAEQSSVPEEGAVSAAGEREPAGAGTGEPSAESSPSPDRAESEPATTVSVRDAEIKWTAMLDEISITSLFGRRWGRNHNGVDFAAAEGTPIYAAYSGTVTRAGWESGFGYLVVIDHGDGIETYYAHNSRIVVAEGERVEAGQHISDAGNTGHSFGSHLHFEVHVDGEPVEPLGYLESAGLPLG